MLKHAWSSLRPVQGYSRWIISTRYSSDIATTSTSGRLSDEEYHRKRKTEWKRRQKGQTFLDSITISIHGGKGGDGCVAFHREKFKPYGPPSGGNGGRGGDVYIQACSDLTTLASVSTRIRGTAGGHGKGTWMHGRNAPPTIIKVPLGTVVKEIDPVDAWGGKKEVYGEGDEEEGGLADDAVKMRQSRWLHYPGAEDDNLGREAFKEAEKMVYQMEREKRMLEREERSGPIFVDLDSESPNPSASTSANTTSPSDEGDTVSHLLSPTRTPHYDPNHGYLLARGGVGGLGNPTFLSHLPQLHSRSPKFATRGSPGQHLTFQLELKLLADVGLVGFPNAGKSTLLRALTRGRSQTEVASYAFTTVNPVVGVVRMDGNGGLLGGSEDETTVIEETKVEAQQFREKLDNGDFAFTSPSLNQSSTSPHYNFETFRFTVADNPGLIHDSSQNRGLGHSFLRSIERALALAYVIDFSQPNPENELSTLKNELENYKSGLSDKARVVVLNKADLLAGEGNEEEVREAKEKLKRVEEFVRNELSKHRVIDVVPISAKYSQNVVKLAGMMKGYVEQEKITVSSLV